VIGVIGTEATIRTGSYQRAVGSGARLVAAACPVFVEHVERGDTTSAALRAAAARYLAPLEQEGVDTVIMGCTHYPLLSGLLQLELGPDVMLVSSADETARDVYAELVRADALRDAGMPPTHAFATTGDPAAFRRLAEQVLGVEVGDVERAVIAEDAA
jgi:glutamate racemase